MFQFFFICLVFFFFFSLNSFGLSILCLHNYFFLPKNKNYIKTIMKFGLWQILHNITFESKKRFKTLNVRQLLVSAVSRKTGPQSPCNSWILLHHHVGETRSCEFLFFFYCLPEGQKPYFLHITLHFQVWRAQSFKWICRKS